MKRTWHKWNVIAALFAWTLLLSWTAPADEPAVPYEAKFQGALKKGLFLKLRHASAAVSERKHPPATMALLEMRVEDDKKRLVESMKAEGYYDAKIDANVTGQSANAKGQRAEVVYHVEPGPIYPLVKANVVLTAGPPELRKKLPSPRDAGLKVGQPARAEVILAAKTKILESLGNLGYPLAIGAEPRVEVDHAARTVSVTYSVNPGPKADFGSTRITGNKEVAEGFIRNTIQWKEGTPYNAKQVEETRKKLRDCGLFSLVNITKAKQLENGRIRLTIAVKERKPHTIKAGVSYNTNEGPGAQVSWEDRNIYQHGERLTLNLKLSKIDDYFESAYSIPQFLRPDQSLRLRGRIEYEDTDAYKGAKQIAEGTVERKFSKEWAGGTGLALESSNLMQQNLHLRDSYHLVSIPTYVNYDTRDNIEDPTKGGLLSLKLTPFQDVAKTDLRFVKALVGYNQHIEVIANPRLVLAGRVALGSILGANLLGVPPDVRFYGGGGGSIRGYRYQYASPLANKKPVGGRSLIEVSGEVRLRVSERIGLVTFLDGGGAFGPELPRFNDGFRWGAGLGVRYFSPVGPFRMDFAVPLNSRNGIDDAFQIYLSMGQAF